MGRRGRDHNSLKYIYLIDTAKEITHRFTLENGKLLPFQPLQQPISFSQAKTTTNDERGVYRTASLTLPATDGQEDDLSALDDSKKDIAGHLPPRLRYIKERTSSGPIGSGEDGSDSPIESGKPSPVQAGTQLVMPNIIIDGINVNCDSSMEIPKNEIPPKNTEFAEEA